MLYKQVLAYKNENPFRIEKKNDEKKTQENFKDCSIFFFQWQMCKLNTDVALKNVQSISITFICLFYYF